MRPPEADVDERPGEEEAEPEQRQPDPTQGDEDRVGRRVRGGEQPEALASRRVAPTTNEAASANAPTPTKNVTPASVRLSAG